MQTWQVGAEAWIAGELERHGLATSGPLDRFYTRPWSAVIRVPTHQGDIFFKAVSDDFKYEAALTQFLAQNYPDVSPQVLSVDVDRGWMLLPHGGKRLREIHNAEGVEYSGRHWNEILPRYASLQISLARQMDLLLSLGVPDRRLDRLAALFLELLDQRDFMRFDQPEGLTLQEWERLKAGVNNVQNIADQLGKFRIPQSLDHADFHDGNVFANHGQYTFFDWGDSGLSHPFFSLRTVFVSIEITFELEQDSPVFADLRDRYLVPWLAYEPLPRLQAAFDLAQRLTPLVAALRWHRSLNGVSQADRQPYAHAVPSLLKELLELNPEL